MPLVFPPLPISRRGMAVAVMVARGAGSGPCASRALFHGARTSDAAHVVKLLRAAANAAAAASAASPSPSSSSSPSPSPSSEGEAPCARGSGPRVYGCGVSMGGIILSNFMVREGLATAAAEAAEAAAVVAPGAAVGAAGPAGATTGRGGRSGGHGGAVLDGAVVLSGGLKIGVTSMFMHSRRLWQPLLTQNLKSMFMGPCSSRMAAKGMDIDAVLDAKDIFEFDNRMVGRL